MKMTSWLAAAAAVTALGGCKISHLFHDGPQVQGSGKLKSEARKVGNFTEVASHGAANCKITVGSGPSVTISGDDNIVPLIETRVEGKTLIIDSKQSYSTKNAITVTISVPNLESFATRGSGDTEIQNVKGKRFAAEISGSGNIKATGQVDRAAYAIRGSGTMEFTGLRARDAEASISGSGDIRLFVMVNLNASIRGSGSISYAGKPDNVQKSVTGSGEIEER